MKACPTTQSPWTTPSGSFLLFFSVILPDLVSRKSSKPYRPHIMQEASRCPWSESSLGHTESRYPFTRPLVKGHNATVRPTFGSTIKFNLQIFLLSSICHSSSSLHIPRILLHLKSRCSKADTSNFGGLREAFPTVCLTIPLGKISAYTLLCLINFLH